MTMFNINELNENMLKELSPIGSILIGKSDILIENNILEAAIGKKYIVTGISTDNTGGQISNYRLFIEGLDSDYQMDTPIDDINAYFEFSSTP